MLLIIPTIDLREDYCVREKNDTYERESVYFDDPVKMARLWRLQNAKALNVVGHDLGGHCRRKVLTSICDAVDIPVQLQGGASSMEAIASAIDAGIYRIVVDVTDEESEAVLAEAVATYGCSKITAGLSADSHPARADYAASSSQDDQSLSEKQIIDIAGRMEDSGCRRFVLSNKLFRDGATKQNVEHIRAFGSSLSKARVTVANCVNGFPDLKIICDLSGARIDSVILDRVLYENAFPCQKFWCWNQKENIDLSLVSTAQLKND